MYTNGDNNQSFVKFDAKNVPINFMAGEEAVQKLHDTVLHLKQSFRSHNELDFAYYDSLYKSIQSNMADKLPHTHIKVQSTYSNTRRRVGKP